jgi:hypothetical protein
VRGSWHCTAAPGRSLPVTAAVSKLSGAIETAVDWQPPRCFFAFVFYFAQPNTQSDDIFRAPIFF